VSQDKDGLDPWFDLSPSSCVGPLGVVRSVFVVGDSFVVQYAWLLSAKPLYLPLCSPGWRRVAVLILIVLRPRFLLLLDHGAGVSCLPGW
jgi:hypothetical protein